MPSRRLAQLPNCLTVLRIIFALIFPWVPITWRFPLLFGASATEYLDGAIARAFGFETRLGQMLDPIADKVFFGAVALTFLWEGRLGWREILILGVRDIAVAIGVLGLLATHRSSQIVWMKPGIFGKISTAIQYGAFLNLFIAPRVDPRLLGLAVTSGVLAVIQYAFGFRLRSRKRTRAGESSKAA